MIGVTAGARIWLAVHFSAVRGLWDRHTTRGIELLSAEIDRRAEMIAYIDVFKLLIKLFF